MPKPLAVATLMLVGLISLLPVGLVFGGLGVIAVGYLLWRVHRIANDMDVALKKQGTAVALLQTKVAEIEARIDEG